METVDVKMLLKEFKLHKLSDKALIKDVVHNKLRSADKSKGKKQSSPLGDYQAGYGEITFGSLQKVLDVLTCDNIEEDPTLLKLMPYRINNESIFLDVGSGAGKVVMLTAAIVGCRSHGIEVVENRYLVARDFVKSLIEEKKLPDHFAHLISFENSNAAESAKAFMLDGMDATHIFINNYVFC